MPAAVSAQTQDKCVVAGMVVDNNGNPLPYVNVFIQNSYEGDVADETGRFEIIAATCGNQILVASLMGYQAGHLEVSLHPGSALRVKIVLQEVAIEMPAATITASSFSSGDEKGVTLKPLEILTTPGAAADIFQAIQTFPGLAHIDEGSGLFVRGGDVSETVTYLDQATVVHPYRTESPTGGLFGTIAPFLVQGTFFSTGGFSAKYGNVLSGVLSMKSLARPVESQYNVNIGLAAASAGVAIPLVKDKLGLRFSGNRSSTGLMFRVNGRYSEFTRHPQGSDGNLSLAYDYSKTGHLKLFMFAAENQVGVKVDQPSFDGVFASDDLNRLYNLQWTQLFRGNWSVQTSLSLNNYETDRSLGILSLHQEDQTYKLRVDVEKEISSAVILNFGGERERMHSNFRGTFPESDVFDPDAEGLAIDADFDAIRTGGFAETSLDVGHGLMVKAGARADHHNLAEQVVFDPRVSLLYHLNPTQSLRLSWGVYHQFPAPLFYAPEYGNPHLSAQRARHVILGYESQTDNTLFRAEAYHKKYDHLAIEHETLQYSNQGYGYARGFDLFLKHGVLFQDKLNGWISYSFLQSQRLQARDTEGGLIQEVAPSAFDITHNLTVVAKYSATDRLSMGLTYRYATGRPFTPVTHAEQDPDFNFYIPFEGPVNSERLPSYQRLDSSVSYMMPLHGSNYAVFYFALSNLLNRKNVLGYDYSRDYSTRTARSTNYSRFVYFGVTFVFR